MYILIHDQHSSIHITYYIGLPLLYIVCVLTLYITLYDTHFCYGANCCRGAASDHNTSLILISHTRSQLKPSDDPAEVRLHNFLDTCSDNLNTVGVIFLDYLSLTIQTPGERNTTRTAVTQNTYPQMQQRADPEVCLTPAFTCLCREGSS